MSTLNSYSASGSSPTKEKKWDFRVEFHGAILLLVPLSDGGLRWIEKHIGADPTAIIEPRFFDGVIADIRRDGLVAR